MTNQLLSYGIFVCALASTGGASAQLATHQPDPIVLASVCKPIFTIDGAKQASGTAFLVERVLGRRRTYLFTAQHLFSFPPSEIARHVTGAECTPPLSETRYVAGPAIPIAGAHPLGALNSLKDVAVFPVIGASPGLPLASSDVQPGDLVWLLAKVSAGAETAVMLHRARVGRTTGFLAYRFDDQSIGLDQTSGGAVINAAGEVVGVNVGYARSSSGDLVGVADRLSTLQSILSALP